MLNDLTSESKYLRSIVEIDKLKTTILDELQLQPHTKKSYKTQLKEYLLVNDLDDLKSGAFLRCIKMEDDEYTLTEPCIFVDIKMTDAGTLLLCRKIWNARQFFHLHMEKTIIFRKLKSDEKMLLLLSLNN